jgi:hypothetical protein
MTLRPEVIDSYFEQYGWSYTRESDDTWITGVRTPVSAFRIMVRVTQHWIYFIINPLVVAPQRSEDRLRIYFHALRYNLDMNFAKLGLDSDGDIFIAIEMPTENFVFSHFVDALDGLSHHASMIYTELFSMAHSSAPIRGRYDEELGYNHPETDPSSGEFNRFSPSESPSRLPDEADSADDENDIIIAGRRLKITDDESGSARVELEGDTDTPDPEEPDPSETAPPEIG